MADILKMTKEVPKRLAIYLESKITTLEKVYQEWPEGNRRIVMPCLSIVTAGPGAYRAEMNPYVIGTADIDGEDVLKTVKYVVGEYDIPLQLDFWCRNKEERHQMFADLVEAFTPTELPSGAQDAPQIGVILELTDYHGIKCHYDLRDHSYDDGEAASQRKEWRVKIDVVATCKAVIEREQPVIIETETQSEISDKPLTD